MDRIKSILKSHFLKQVYPNGQPNPKRIDSLISKHIYSHSVVEQRKRKFEEDLHRVNYSTPKAKRCLLSSKLNRKQMSKCLAPRVSRCPMANRARRRLDPDKIHMGPGKNKKPPDKLCDTPTRLSKRTKTDTFL